MEFGGSAKPIVFGSKSPKSQQHVHAQQQASGGAKRSKRSTRPAAKKQTGESGGSAVYIARKPNDASGAVASSSKEAVGVDAMFGPKERDRRESRKQRFKSAMPQTMSTPSMSSLPATMATEQQRQQIYTPGGGGGGGGGEKWSAALSREQRRGEYGACEDMCPAAERAEREHWGEIDPLERMPGGDARKADPRLAVKKYKRLMDEDDKVPEKMRTRGALQRTVTHLWSLLDGVRREDFAGVQKFVWDRLRSVRQDLVMQGIRDLFSVRLHEEMVRFHVFAEHDLCEERRREGEPDGFDSHLNVEQMNKCLVTLFEVYETEAARGKPVPSEGEFRAYFLLLQLDTHGSFKREAEPAALRLMGLRPNVVHSPEMRFALEVFTVYRAGNWVRFFRLLDEAPYMAACVMHIFFRKAQAQALKLMNELGAKGAHIRIGDVCEGLHMSASECVGMCEHHNICVTRAAGAADEDATIVIKQNSFHEREDDFPPKTSDVVAKKLAIKRADCVRVGWWHSSSPPPMPALPMPRACAAPTAAASSFLTQRRVADAARAGVPSLTSPEGTARITSTSVPSLRPPSLPGTGLTDATAGTAAVVGASGTDADSEMMAVNGSDAMMMPFTTTVPPASSALPPPIAATAAAAPVPAPGLSTLQNATSGTMPGVHHPFAEGSGRVVTPQSWSSGTSGTLFQPLQASSSALPAQPQLPHQPQMPSLAFGSSDSGALTGRKRGAEPHAAVAAATIDDAEGLERSAKRAAASPEKSKSGGSLEHHSAAYSPLSCVPQKQLSTSTGPPAMTQLPASKLGEAHSAEVAGVFGGKQTRGQSESNAHPSNPATTPLMNAPAPHFSVDGDASALASVSVETAISSFSPPTLTENEEDDAAAGIFIGRMEISDDDEKHEKETAAVAAAAAALLRLKLKLLVSLWRHRARRAVAARVAAEAEARRALQQTKATAAMYTPVRQSLLSSTAEDIHARTRMLSSSASGKLLACIEFERNDEAARFMVPVNLVDVVGEQLAHDDAGHIDRRGMMTTMYTFKLLVASAGSGSGSGREKIFPGEGGDIDGSANLSMHSWLRSKLGFIDATHEVVACDGFLPGIHSMGGTGDVNVCTIVRDVSPALSTGSMRDIHAAGSSGVVVSVEGADGARSLRATLDALLEKVQAFAHLPVAILWKPSSRQYLSQNGCAIPMPSLESGLGCLRLCSTDAEAGAVAHRLGLNGILGQKVSSWTIFMVDGNGGAPTTAGLLQPWLARASGMLDEALRWVATVAPAPPRLQLRYLRDVVHDEMHARGIRDDEGAFAASASVDDATVAHLVARFNDAVASCIHRLEESYVGIPRYAWPPPEASVEAALSGGDVASSLPTPEWNSEAAYNAKRDALLRLQLPALGVAGDDDAELTRQQLEEVSSRLDISRSGVVLPLASSLMSLVRIAIAERLARLSETAYLIADNDVVDDNMHEDSHAVHGKDSTRHVLRALQQYSIRHHGATTEHSTRSASRLVRMMTPLSPN